MSNLVERGHDHAAAVLVARVAARMIDQDAPHHVAAIAKKCARSRQAVHVDEPQVRFVGERRRLQRVAGALGLHVVVGEAMQLVVDDQDERVGGRQDPGRPEPAAAGRSARVPAGRLGRRSCGRPAMSTHR